MPLWMWPQCRGSRAHTGKKGNYTRMWKSMCTSQIESASYDPLQGHDKKHDLSPASPAYQLSVMTPWQVRFQWHSRQMWLQIMNHSNICLRIVEMPLLFQSSETWKLMTGWLMAAHSTLWARRGFKCTEWGWLNEKSVQCALSSNTWECLRQAFQEGDQYNSYHVSHIDHWLSIVICVPNGKPMLLVLKIQTERGTQRDGEETVKSRIHNLEQILFKTFKCMKGASVSEDQNSQFHAQ